MPGQGLTPAVLELAERARRLSLVEREALITEIAISLDGDPEADLEEVAQAWEEEIARRIAADERGEVQWIDGQEVLEQLAKTIEEHRPRWEKRLAEKSVLRAGKT